MYIQVHFRYPLIQKEFFFLVFLEKKEPGSDTGEAHNIYLP